MKTPTQGMIRSQSPSQMKGLGRVPATAHGRMSQTPRPTTKPHRPTAQMRQSFNGKPVMQK